MSSVEQKPGEIVALAGVYWVIHHEHRGKHQVFLDGGTLFPLCRRCHEKVRFVHSVQVEPTQEKRTIYSDLDFAVRRAATGSEG